MLIAATAVECAIIPYGCLTVTLPAKQVSQRRTMLLGGVFSWFYADQWSWASTPSSYGIFHSIPIKVLVLRLFLQAAALPFTTTKHVPLFQKSVYLQVTQFFGQKLPTSPSLLFGPLDFPIKTLSPLGRDLLKIPILGFSFQLIYGTMPWTKSRSARGTYLRTCVRVTHCVPLFQYTFWSQPGTCSFPPNGLESLLTLSFS